MAKTKGVPGVVEQLRNAIRGSGQSLNQLSKTTGVGPDRLSRFLRGQRDLTLEAVERICHVLGLGLHALSSEPPAPKKRRPKK